MALRSDLRTSRRSPVLRMAGDVCVHRKDGIKCLLYRTFTLPAIHPGDNGTPAHIALVPPYPGSHSRAGAGRQLL